MPRDPQGDKPGEPRKTARNGHGEGRGSAERSGGKVTHNPLTSSPQDIGRTLPHSLEAEQGVLGSMLISPREIIAECVEKISEEYFYVPELDEDRVDRLVRRRRH